MAGGLILNWILGVILFFALWALIMRLIRIYSIRHSKQDLDEATAEEKTENATEKDEEQA